MLIYMLKKEYGKYKTGLLIKITISSQLHIENGGEVRSTLEEFEDVVCEMQ